MLSLDLLDALRVKDVVQGAALQGTAVVAQVVLATTHKSTQKCLKHILLLNSKFVILFVHVDEPQVHVVGGGVNVGGALHHRFPEIF